MNGSPGSSGPSPGAAGHYARVAHDSFRETLFPELKPPLDSAAALLEARRCLQCGTGDVPAPCSEACPAAIDVPGFIAAIAAGSGDRAADLILGANPLGGSCARVCPTEELCEGACILGEAGRRPVDIARLQRYATDPVWNSGDPPGPMAGPPSSPFRVAVVGAGPAGMACAAELADAGYQVAVYEARPEPGGLARYAIAPYRLMQFPLAEEMRRLANKGVVFHWNSEISGKSAWDALAAEVDAVFLGVGLGEDMPANYPGMALRGVWQSLPFIERIKTGNPPTVGNTVAVVGGGNTAIDVAREALRLGAKQVHILYRRTRAEMPAYAQEVREAEAEGIRFQWLTQPVRFLGRGRLEAVECQYMRLTEPDETGRQRPEAVPGTEFRLSVDSVILAIGQAARPLTDWIPGLALDKGRIVVDSATGQTRVPKFFAGGDGVNGGATVVEAVRMGKLAAHGIRQTLEGACSVESREPLPVPDVVPELGPYVEYQQASGLILGVRREWCKGCNLCVDDCPVDILQLDENEQVYVTDIGACLGCGVCAVRCPDFVLVLNQVPAAPVSV